MGLTTASYLGDNTVAMLSVLAERLVASGIDIECLPSGSSHDAVRDAGDLDLLWACGLLTIEMISAGEIDAQIVAAPVFAGQDGPLYHSVLVARAEERPSSMEEAVGKRLAINEERSWSGHHALARHLAASDLSMEMFDEVTVTGSHRDSVAALARREADLAAIDHTVWEAMTVGSADGRELVVFDRTADWPAPPFSLRADMDPGVRSQILDVLTSVRPGDISGIDGVAPASVKDYEIMRQPSR